MEKIKFLVQGSSDDPYEVTFTKSGNNLSALCTCPAGQNGMYCKHRFRILAGSKEGIISTNNNEVTTVNSWLPGSDIESTMKELADAEIELLNAQKRVSACKKKLSRKMFD